MAAYNDLSAMNFVNVNVHLHTPYSFSAFSDIDDALDRAVAENVKVVGINDFTLPKVTKSGRMVAANADFIPPYSALSLLA